MENITQLLGDKLPPEVANSLQEAFDKKVSEVREQTEMALREEFARRYDHDKENLVEAIDRMLSDVIQKHETAKGSETAKFVEARTAFRKAIKESRKTFRAKLAEQVEVSRLVVATKLREEIRKLREARKSITGHRLSYADKLASVKESLAADHAKRVAKIDEFVVQQVGKELKEFHQDHKALVATRVKLVAEGRQRLRDVQNRFVRESAKKVEKVINETLKAEMGQLHEDLERNRQNMFGRRIFEAVAAEFMTSYLAEGTEIRKLQNILENKKTELAEAKVKLEETMKENQQAVRKAKLAEDRITRTKIMGELLSNLRGEKRTIMEGMLETIRTDSLRASFDKLLPIVLDESGRSKLAPSKRVPLTEKVEKPSTVVTGGQRANRLAEAAEAEAMEMDPDIAKVIRLAGIK